MLWWSASHALGHSICLYVADFFSHFDKINNVRQQKQPLLFLSNITLKCCRLKWCCWGPSPSQGKLQTENNYGFGGSAVENGNPSTICGSNVPEIFIFLSSNKKCPIFVKIIFLSWLSNWPIQFFVQKFNCPFLVFASFHSIWMIYPEKYIPLIYQAAIYHFYNEYHHDTWFPRYTWYICVWHFTIDVSIEIASFFPRNIRKIGDISPKYHHNITIHVSLFWYTMIYRDSMLLYRDIKLI